MKSGFFEEILFCPLANLTWAMIQCFMLSKADGCLLEDSLIATNKEIDKTNENHICCDNYKHREFKKWTLL